MLNSVPTAATNDEPVVEFDRQTAVAHVETDRFCDHCGYNLRTQPVRRDPRTQLLMCRCPECGHFLTASTVTTAGQVWLHRLGTFLLFVWVLTLLGIGFGLCAAQMGMTVVTLEELTTYRRQTISPITPLPTGPALTIPGTSTTIIYAQPASAPAPASPNPWRREIRDSIPYYYLFAVLMVTISFGLGFLLVLLAAVALHHWRRWGYVIIALVVPVLIGVLVWLIWAEDVPHLRHWATPYVIGHAAAHLLGGLLAVYAGRPFARLVITLSLPPRVRQVLAFLWFADGKRLPGTPAST